LINQVGKKIEGSCTARSGGTVLHPGFVFKNEKLEGKKSPMSEWARRQDQPVVMVGLL
jgi:hypothetical protein